MVINEANLLTLKMYLAPVEPSAINEHDVPVLLEDPASFLRADWDITIQHVVPYIDGVKHVSRLALEAKV
jgi:hypothetical protein